jgi:hypothetical protein
MTKAEKLLNSNPLEITLTSNSSSETDDEPILKEKYIAEFKPGFINPLLIKDINSNQNEQILGNEIFISYESAVELAKFLKELFLDEEPK